MERLSNLFGSTVSNSPIVSKGSSVVSLPSLPVQLPAGLANRSTPQLLTIAGAATFGSILLLGTISRLTSSAPPAIVLSPGDTLLPTLSEEEIKDLPYPPHALPGSRDVKSPYGTIRVYEWGPKEGERVLLIHGISTPSIALTDVAYKLVEKGCRVMLFGKHHPFSMQACMHHHIKFWFLNPWRDLPSFFYDCIRSSYNSFTLP